MKTAIEIYKKKVADGDFLDNKQQIKWLEAAVEGLGMALIYERVASITYNRIRNDISFLEKELIRLDEYEFSSALMDLNK